jgi:membrane associated rhomboid family serine protease
MPLGVELSYALSWLVGANVLFGAVQAIPQYRAQIRGWFYVNLAVLLFVLVGTYAEVSGLGYIATVLWLAFVVIPLRFSKRLQAALNVADFERARRWATVVAVLHPFDGYREQRAILTSYCQEATGHIEAAKRTLVPLITSKNWGERGTLELLRLDSRWDEIVAHLYAQPVGKRLLQLAPLYLRALGETRNLDRMWALYAQLPVHFAVVPIVRLQVAAMTGLSDVVDELLKRYFAATPQSLRDLWRSDSLMAEGKTDEASRLLHKLVHESRFGRPRATHRLTYPLARSNVAELSQETQQIIAIFRQNLRKEVAFMADKSLERPRRPYATYGLLTLLGAVFAITVVGGSYDVENLVRLGALVLPCELVDGELVWRVIAAGFLHLGATHWGMNSLGLLILGRQLEQLWNGKILLLIFLGSSVGSFGLAALTIHATVDDPRILLGASSGVMGLVGALGTFFLCGYVMRKSSVLGQRLLSVLAVLAMQSVFDWFTPQVSFRLHLSGFGLGALIAIPFAVKTWTQQSEKRATLAPLAPTSTSAPRRVSS